MSEPDDLLDDILGIAPGSPLDALRRGRSEARRHAGGAYREPLSPDDPGTVSHVERAAPAARYRAMRDRAAAAESVMLAEDLSTPPR